MKRPIIIAVAAACAAVIVPATTLSQDAARKVKIDVTSTYPTSLTLVGEAAPRLAKRVLRASGGTIEMKIHEPGALVPGLQAIQAVARGSVDAAWSAPGFFSGTDAVIKLFTTVPF